MPTHESQQRRRLSPPAARAAPPALPRPFPQPDPSPQSPSSVTSLCRVLPCKVAAPPGRGAECESVAPLLRAGMGWGNLPAGTAAGNFLVVAAGGVGGEVVDTDDDGTEQ